MSAEHGLALHSLADVERLASIAVASRLTKLARVEEASIILMTGAELGLAPMQALRGIYVVDGKPTLSADAMVAIVRRSGLCESWRVVESTPERCTITTRRKGESADAARTWTRADAERAGVTGKDPWRKYPAAMLRHRCAADLARQEYPDVILGLYDPEELGADPSPDDVPAQPVPVAVVVEQPVPSWASDLAGCSTLRDVRACWSSHRTPDTDGAAMARDVRAWLSERGLSVTADAVTAILGPLHEGAISALSVALCSDSTPAEGIETAIVDAARALRAATDVDAHSRGVAWKILRRAYTTTTNAPSLDVGREALLAAMDATDGDDPPPTGTDTPTATARAEDDGSAPAAYEAHRAAQTATVASLDAVAERASADPRLAAVRDHLASKRVRNAVYNSVRAHWSEILADNAVRDLYAARLRAVVPPDADDARTSEEHDADARALITRWAAQARDEGNAA